MSHEDFPDSIKQQISQLDQVWREWLFGDLESSEAISRTASTERVFYELIADAETEALETSMIAKGRIEPFVSAMLTSIAAIRESGLNSSNAFVRGSEFHKHLPSSCLVPRPGNGVLTVPFPGETGPCL